LFLGTAYFRLVQFSHKCMWNHCLCIISNPISYLYQGQLSQASERIDTR